MNPKYTGILADITAFLTILAALPYELGPVSDILSPEWKKYVATCGLIATLVLRLIKRGQTGGASAQAAPVPAPAVPLAPVVPTPVAPVVPTPVTVTNTPANPVHTDQVNQ